MNFQDWFRTYKKRIAGPHEINDVSWIDENQCFDAWNAAEQETKKRVQADLHFILNDLLDLEEGHMQENINRLMLRRSIKRIKAIMEA